MSMELLRELGVGFAMGDGANINRVAQLLLAVLTMAVLCCGSLQLRIRLLQRSISERRALVSLPKTTSATRMVTVTTRQRESTPIMARLIAPHGSRIWRGIVCKLFHHARTAGERHLHLQRAESRDSRFESAMAMRECPGFALSRKDLNSARMCVPRVPAFERRYIDAEQSLQARREAVYAAESSCDADSTGGKTLDADKKDTNGVLWGLLRNFLRAASFKLAALPRSLLTCFTSHARRGPLLSLFKFLPSSNHLTTLNNLIVKILFFCSIGFHFMSGANAQDHTDNGKPVYPEVWKTSDNMKAAAMASLIGGVGVAVWILYNRRNTFSLNDINEGLMRGPAVVRRSDPTFETPPSIEPRPDTE